MKIQQIGNVTLTREKPLLILEAGVNHEGSLDTAFEMIDAAADAGADMIKFQSYKAETLASKHSPAYWDQTKETASSQYSLFKQHDRFGDDEYRALAKRCAEKGILFCSTPFDDHFIDLLEPLMPAYKIASADLTNVPFLRKIARKGKPVLLSVGASYLAEVEEAVRVIAEAGNDQVALLHCVLEYPTAPEHANLAVIDYLARVFPENTIGYSDHVPPVHGPLTLLTAWMRGADILEKHYTLDKSLPGNDHYHAMDPDDVREYVKQQQFVGAMLGDGRKTVPSWEETPRRYARRSLVATRYIPAGTPLTEEMLTAKRPGTGISPVHYDLFLGRVAQRDIDVDDVLVWEMFLPEVKRAALKAAAG